MARGLHFRRHIHLLPLRARHFAFRRDRQRRLYRCAVVLLAVTLVLVLADIRLRPLVRGAGAHALRNELTLLLGDSVRTAAASLDYSASDFVTLERSADGTVCAAVARTDAVNAFRAALAKSAAETVDRCADFSLSVPLGTLLGSQIFSGMGPRITVNADTYGFALTDVVSTFESVGINQTVHRITVNASLSASTYIGTYHVAETVESSVPVAETIIVGQVPQTYVTGDTTLKLP